MNRPRAIEESAPARSLTLSYDRAGNLISETPHPTARCTDARVCAVVVGSLTGLSIDRVIDAIKDAAAGR